MKHFVLFFCLTFIVKFTISQEQKTSKTEGFMDFNGYYDTREFSVLTINMMANFPNRFQYFSLTNYEGQSTTSDIGNLYSEHNLRYPVSRKLPLDYTLQYVLRSGLDNDDIRLGFRWRLTQTPWVGAFLKKHKVFVSANPMVVQFRENASTKWMTQIEYVYNFRPFKKLLKNKLYFAGFADQNFLQEDSKTLTKWVTEHQVGYSVLKNFYVVLEYRINDFSSKVSGLGYGLEYKIVF